MLAVHRLYVGDVLFQRVGEFGESLGVTVSRGLLDLPADSGHLLETEAARGTVQNVADPACGREIAKALAAAGSKGPA